MELLFTDFCEEPFAVVIVTHIMKKTHNFKSSPEIVFTDSTSSCNPNNHSITFMLRTCSASTVPIAVIIMKRQSEESYVKGFQFVNRVLENILWKGKSRIFHDG